MGSVRKKLLISLTCILIMVTGLIPSLACGPFFEDAFFSYSLHPDFPLSKFASGDLGIVKPTYSRSYLIAAYSYFTGKPLNLDQQKQFEKLWQYRLLAADMAESSEIDSTTNMHDPIAVWLKSRGEVSTNHLDKIENFRPVSAGTDNYNSFENCPHEAFKTAVETLKKYESKYGQQSPYVKDWVEAQDKVFCHCGAGRYDYQTKQNAPEGPFPEPLPENTDPQLKDDRDYQIACAHFYAIQYDLAEKEFLAIARDTSSPWQDLGGYLAARSMIRKGTMADKVDIPALNRASFLLEEILKDDHLTKMHVLAHQLLDFISVRTQPEERLLVLAKEILDPTKAQSLFQNLYDYTFLLDQYFPDTSEDETSQPKPLPASFSNDDLTDWIITFQTNGSQLKEVDAGRAKALKNWRETHSLAWLIAALSKTTYGSAEEQEAIEAAKLVPVSSPGYITVSYYLVKLLIQGKQINLASQRLRNLLSLNLPPSARNDFLSLQMSIAPSLKEFMELAVRYPANTFADSGAEIPFEVKELVTLPTYQTPKVSCFVHDAADVLNYKMPLEMLSNVVQMSNIPAQPHFDLVQAVWTRAVLLNRDDLATKLAPLMKKLRPQIGPLIDGYAQAATPAAKHFAACFLILKNPGMRPYVKAGVARTIDLSKIEDYGDNWWGSKGMIGDANGFSDQSPKIFPTDPPFLNSTELSEAAKDLASLKSLGEAPNILTATVLNYARTHPDDSRVPEALHRCVKSTRFGSTDAKTTDYSKQAFQLLHKRYGKSSWAAQTPYYY